ncbi:MAG: SGNH/GDSL hydrolase family protein [bacterium]|nr:SGNH/GDSL hydrolase family protein [bacterium]
MTASRPERPQRRRRRLLLLATASFGALVAAEIVARFAIARLNATPKPPPSVATEAKLIDLLRPAESPDVIYSLRPNLDCRFLGKRVTTDAHGRRVAAAPKPADSDRPAGTLRILGLGDSVLFGWGVEHSETGLARLERQLQLALGDRPVRTLNTGVPGHNTAMEIAAFANDHIESCAASDIVLLHFVGNDLELPTFLLAEADYWRLDHCFLYDLALRAWRSDWLDPRTALVWTEGNHGTFESDPDRVPAQYRHLVGLPAFRRAIERLATLVRERDLRLLVTSQHDLPTEIGAILDDHGIAQVSLAGRIRSWLQEQGTNRLLGSALTISATDPHPTPMVHAWWAEAVAAKLAELGWLAR